MSARKLALVCTATFLLHGCASPACRYDWVKSDGSAYRVDSTSGEISELRGDKLVPVFRVAAPNTVSTWQDRSVDVVPFDDGHTAKVTVKTLWKDDLLYYAVKVGCADCLKDGKYPWTVHEGSLVFFDANRLPILRVNVFTGESSIVKLDSGSEYVWRDFFPGKDENGDAELGAVPCSLADYSAISKAACSLVSSAEAERTQKLFEDIERKKAAQRGS